MHTIEPFYGWRDYYIASEDNLSPFFNQQYSEFEFSQQIYNYYLHPQWDFFGSSTLYCKLLFAEYETGVAVIELIGEWNDALHNDIMEFRNGVINHLQHNGINKFILLGENVLNFHASDDLYYEEWHDELKDEGGWIMAVNFREHVAVEMQKARIHYHIHLGEKYGNIPWRKFKPTDFCEFSEDLLMKFLRN